jgi:hypothetical protein
MIARLEPVPLRDLWKHEEYGFSVWLCENIGDLSKDLGITLTDARREVRVGTFEVDIVAEDQEGNRVIIENQLEQTNHDHLGKLLTYLTNLEAKTAIWIASEARPEHVRAVSWLNEVTPDDIAFYLVKLAAYRINQSPPAPMFTVLARPSVEGKAIGKEKKELAERHVLRIEFWSALLARAKTQGFLLHENRSPSKDHWLSGASGKSGVQFNYLVFMGDGAAIELYIGNSDKTLNKKLFDKLQAQRQTIEESCGTPIEWERLEDKVSSRIRWSLETPGIQSRESWYETQDKMISAMKKFFETLKPHLQSF